MVSWNLYTRPLKLRVHQQNPPNSQFLSWISLNCPNWKLVVPWWHCFLCSPLAWSLLFPTFLLLGQQWGVLCSLLPVPCHSPLFPANTPLWMWFLIMPLSSALCCNLPSHGPLWGTEPCIVGEWPCSSLGMLLALLSTLVSGLRQLL